jgi:ribonuclease Z
MRPLTVVSMVVLAAVATGCVDAQVRAQFLKADRGMLASPAMHLVLCGTGGAIADQTRAGACSAIVAAGKAMLVDVGPGAWEGALAARLPPEAVRDVFLTSFLADNIGDIGEVMSRGWILGRPRQLVVHGPPGTSRLVANIADAYHFDTAMRLAHHDPDVLQPAIAGARAHEFALEADETAVVLDEGGLRVTAFSVGAVGVWPSVGYRFDFGGRSIVIAGHSHGHPNVARFAVGADILVHEALNPEMVARGIGVMERVGQERIASLTREMLPAHASPVEVATLARDAGVGRVVFSRVYPPVSDPLSRWAFLRGVRAIFPNAVLGEDGMRFRLDPTRDGG